ncbi:pyridoxamine 5'-phosphate oxidase family protein [Streptomyces sp. NPDC057877]|uniref:pyridoxamine 5'-phosphate oxidase family protein n=1 Tax=Streptomyces sp. NPDC057877 TaxID=3346269 RepID=UPI0036B00387
MKITETPRTPVERKRRLLERLEREQDVWVATADAAGVPCMVALWFAWDGRALWVSTRLTNPTGRNLRDGGRARVAFGDTRDVALVDGEVDTFPAGEVPQAAVAALRAKYGWDPRGDGASYAFFRVRPRTVQVYRGEAEMRGRFLMKEGAWTV